MPKEWWAYGRSRRLPGRMAPDQLPARRSPAFSFSHPVTTAWCGYSVEPQRFFAERWNPTDTEKIRRFNSLVVNSGTYEIKGSILTAHPIVARIPEFVGGKLICEYRLENDTMRLAFIDEYSYDGIQAPWVTSGSGLILKLVRID